MATTESGARFDLSLATLGDTSIAAGESVEVAVWVDNPGDREGTVEVDLSVDGQVVASESVTVEAGGAEPVVFEPRFDDPGEYELAVGDESLGTLTVRPASEDATTATPTVTDGTAGSIRVVSATVTADWVREGFATTVRATVVNAGDRAATRTLAVTVDGVTVATERVSLEPEERRVVSVEFDAVDGTVAVGGREAGRIQVGETDGDRRTDATGRGDPTFGGSPLPLAVVVAVLGLLTGVGVYLARRR